MPRRTPPVITLTTDFGLQDSYVAEMKAVLLREVPDVRIVDVTHHVPPQDLLAGSIVLERAVRAFAAGTVHVAVVDPGVGSDRRIVVVSVAGQTLIGPDNGLITWAWRRHPGAVARELTWRPPRSSATFHGRDVMAPAAAMIAGGTRVAKMSKPIADPILLDVAPARRLDEAHVIHLDHFGNATTNVPAELLAGGRPAIRLGRRRITFHVTYAAVPVGQPLSLIGSSGLLEIAVRNGSAARDLNLKVGDRILIAP